MILTMSLMHYLCIAQNVQTLFNVPDLYMSCGKDVVVQATHLRSVFDDNRFAVNVLYAL